MRKKGYKGRCEKRSLPKFEGVCKTFDPIQYAYADILSGNKDIESIRCNVCLDGEECSEYMTDFVCTKVTPMQHMPMRCNTLRMDGIWMTRWMRS